MLEAKRGFKRYTNGYEAWYIDEHPHKDVLRDVNRGIYAFPQQMYFPYKDCKDTEVGYTPQYAFRILIDKISKKGTWESNPWVYAYTFELIK